jgi:hypothetical protein
MEQMPKRKAASYREIALLIKVSRKDAAPMKNIW